MTPEGKVKNEIKKKLKELQEKYKGYHHCPVQNGMGAPTLDFVVHLLGHTCWIEAKAPGEHLTPRQMTTKQKIELAGVPVFMIDGSNEGWDHWHVWIGSCIAHPVESAFVLC